MSSLLPPSASSQERAIDESIARLGDGAPDYGQLWRPEDCPAEFLPWLAWALSVDFWRSDLPDEVKRNLIKGSFNWHRIKGTPYAVTWLLSQLGYQDVEIIEYIKARERFAAIGGARLDGTWQVVADGDPAPTKLMAYDEVIGLPDMEHWAQFAVRINLLEASRPDWVQELKWAVETAKNARSWPVWAYWMLLELLATPTQDLSFYMLKEVAQPYPWCSPKLDGTWKVGFDAQPYRLDGSLLVDGSWQLGGILHSAMPYEHLRQCNILETLFMRKEIERPDRHIAARLGESRLRLGKHWQVGMNRILALAEATVSKDIEASAGPDLDVTERFSFPLAYPASPRQLRSKVKLARWRRLDGSWGVGRAALPLPLDGAWKVRSPGVRAEASTSIKKAFYGGICGKLGRAEARIGQKWSRKLDGQWQVAASHKVDGAWRLDGISRLSAPHLGPFYRQLDGSWGLRATKFLDGSWKVGAPGPACTMDIVIRRAA